MISSGGSPCPVCERTRGLCYDCRGDLKRQIERRMEREGITHFILPARKSSQEATEGTEGDRSKGKGLWRRVCRRVECWMGLHHWTCAAQLGIPATKEQLAGGVAGFYDYARMFCEDCGVGAKPVSDAARARRGRE